ETGVQLYQVGTSIQFFKGVLRGMDPSHPDDREGLVAFLGQESNDLGTSLPKGNPTETSLFLGLDQLGFKVFSAYSGIGGYDAVNIGNTHDIYDIQKLVLGQIGCDLKEDGLFLRSQFFGQFYVLLLQFLQDVRQRVPVLEFAKSRGIWGADVYHKIVHMLKECLETDQIILDRIRIGGEFVLSYVPPNDYSVLFLQLFGGL